MDTLIDQDAVFQASMEQIHQGTYLNISLDMPHKTSFRVLIGP